jgi:hypothetical protein
MGYSDSTRYAEPAIASVAFTAVIDRYIRNLEDEGIVAPPRWFTRAAVLADLDELAEVGPPAAITAVVESEWNTFCGQRHLGRPDEKGDGDGVEGRQPADADARTGGLAGDEPVQAEAAPGRGVSRVGVGAAAVGAPDQGPGDHPGVTGGAEDGRRETPRPLRGAERGDTDEAEYQ